jgi:glycosyltransferase involved in cell wall biosynthesis
MICFICSVKVLILHQHFNTPYDGGAIRSYYLAKALVDKGIETVVITGSNDKKGVQNIDGIIVHYLKIPYDNSFGFLKRGISFLRFISLAVREAKNISKVDLCYAISVPLTIGVAAMRIKKKFGLPFIFEVGDLWPEAPIEMGFIKNPILKNYLIGLERKIYNEAECVVALSPSIANGVSAVAPNTKIYELPNMADTDFYKPEKKNRELEKKFAVEGEFVISYIGALGFANGLNHFLDLAGASKTSMLAVKFLICGEGAMRNKIEKRIASEKLENVSLLPFATRDGVHEIMNVTDACFISYLPYKVLETGSPNKYFDGLAAGKMIITNFGGWIREEIEREKIGFSFDNDPQDFVNKLNLFLGDAELLRAAQLNARTLAERKYSRAILSEKFLTVVRGPHNQQFN